MSLLERVRSDVTINQVVALVLALVGLRIGLMPLHDNSFFTHLATGHLILDEGSVPRADPYSFTAFGRAWTVQSWGASVIYAGIDDLVGLTGIRVLVATCTTALALAVWRLSRPAEGLVGRLALSVPAIAIGASVWVERPLLFALLFLVAVLFALEGELDPRWLVPIMWLWVNIHGSFPLALVAIGAFGLGRVLDRERPALEIRVFCWAVAGTLLGAINPLGPRLLVFPVQLLSRREAFSQIVEWQPPTWQGWGEQMFAIQLALAVVLLLWRGRSWRAALPLIIFGAASLQSTRNIAQASLVFIPGMAVAVKGLGTIDGRVSVPVLKPVRAVLAGLFLVMAVVGLNQPNLDLSDYPVDSLTWMRENDLLELNDRVVTRDFVGNFLELELGPDEVRVYFDDRVDMYPIEMIDDYRALIDEDGDYQAVLDRAGATAVVWDTDTPFTAWLEDPANGWTVVHREDLWIVAVPADQD